MSASLYTLSWISPTISQKEIESLHARWNELLVASSAETQSFSKVSVQPFFEPADAVLIQMPLVLESEGVFHVMRSLLWDLAQTGKNISAIPFALSLLPTQNLKAKKKLVVFDMDSTLINQEVIDELARTQGIYEQVSRITEEAMKGNLSFTEALIARCKLLKGMSLHQASQIIGDLTLSPGGAKLIQTLRAKGIKTAVVSGGFEFVLRHFQKLHDLDHVYGNNLERDDEDFFTGSVLDPIVDAEYKKKLVANLKTQYQFTAAETVVLGDGANDIPMMSEAGTQISFCGKPRLSSVVNTLILDRNLLWILPLL